MAVAAAAISVQWAAIWNTANAPAKARTAAVSYTHLPCFHVDQRLMVVLKNGLLLNGVLYAVLDLVRGLFRLEVYQTAGVLPIFKDMHDGVSVSYTHLDVYKRQSYLLLRK